jgi:dolichyl-phosphate beta-glucosyltransferase
MQSTIIVVPCYNEELRLPAERFVAAARSDPSLSFVLVDDGSRDGTRALLESLSKQSPQLELLALQPNGGKAEAVRRGMLRAFERAPAFAGYLDADLATPFSELEPMRRLLESRSQLNVVLGSRVGLLGRDVQRSLHRHYLGRVFATIASAMLGVGVYDTQCGAKLFRNIEPIRQAFVEPFQTRWTFDVELIARLQALAHQGAMPPLQQSGAEYPVTEWRDVAGSKLGARAIAGAGVDLMKLWLRYKRPG